MHKLRLKLAYKANSYFMNRLICARDCSLCIQGHTKNYLQHERVRFLRASEWWYKAGSKVCLTPKGHEGWVSSVKGGDSDRAAINWYLPHSVPFPGELQLLELQSQNTSVLNKCVNVTKSIYFNFRKLSKETYLAFQTHSNGWQMFSRLNYYVLKERYRLLCQDGHPTFLVTSRNCI